MDDLLAKWIELNPDKELNWLQKNLKAKAVAKKVYIKSFNLQQMFSLGVVMKDKTTKEFLIDQIEELILLGNEVDSDVTIEDNLDDINFESEYAFNEIKHTNHSSIISRDTSNVNNLTSKPTVSSTTLDLVPYVNRGTIDLTKVD